MTATATAIPQFAKRWMVGCNCRGWNTAQFPHEIADRLIPAWVKAENNTARFNPLSCTLWLPSATPYNTFTVNGQTFHVWNYAHAQDGLAAHLQTIANGNYNGILGDMQAALTSGKTAEQIVADRRAQFQTWGTNPDAITAVLADLT